MNVGELEIFRREKLLHETHGSDEAIVRAHIDGKGRPMYKSTEYKFGKVGLMCPHCFNFMIRMVNFTSSIMIENEDPTDVEEPEMWMFNDVVYSVSKCKFCEKETVNLIPIDANIVEAIGKLNKKGYTTKFSCEGHGDNLGYIYFENHTISKYFNTLPITWYSDIPDFRSNNMCIIRSDSCNYEEGIIDLNEWVDSLPNASGIRISDQILRELRHHSEAFTGFELPVFTNHPSIQLNFQEMSEDATVDRILTNLKLRSNSAFYGLIKTFGNFHN